MNLRNPSLPPAVQPQLSFREAHLWSADLRQPAHIVQHLRSILSADERWNAGRFRLGRDRSRYVVCRGLLRCLLGRYLGVQGHDIAFRYSERGKPSIQAEMNAPGIHFNVAHSQDRAVYAFAAGLAIGVDLEFIRPIPEASDIAGYLFPPELVRSLDLKDSQCSDHAFLGAWTAWEAFHKALGHGLSQLSGAEAGASMTELESEFARKPGISPRGWSIRTFHLAPDFVGAVAVEGEDCNIQTFNARARDLFESGDDGWSPQREESI